MKEVHHPSGASRFRFWIALAPAMVVPFLAALLYFVICDTASIARGIYAAAKLFLVVWPLLMYYTMLRGQPGLAPGRKCVMARALFLGVLSGVVISLIITVFLLTPLGRTVEAASTSMRERAEHLGVMAYYWPFAIFLSVVHSLIEEYYWRWFVYGRLRQVSSPGIAIALSSIAFASHHVIITGQLMSWPLGILCGVGIGLGGGFWAWLYSRTGRLIAPWISHALIDFTVMGIYRVSAVAVSR